MSRKRRKNKTTNALSSSTELNLQIVLLAIATTFLACVSFIVDLFIIKNKDPVISFILTLILGILCIFLGGSIVFGYYKTRVGAQARKHAEAMIEKAEAMVGKDDMQALAEQVKAILTRSNLPTQPNLGMKDPSGD